MKIRTDFPHAVREIENLWIPMPDGVRLAARVWLPEDAEANPVPAILEFIPYRKREGMSVRDAIMHPWFAGHGYAAVRVDLRGSGDSEGLLDDEYCPQEQEDGLAVIDWLSRQPWCSGRVGMIGISWGGFNGLQIAARRPPALAAVVSVGSTDDRYADDVHYMGGCVLTATFTWAQTFFSDLSRPPDPLIVGACWREIWLDRLHNATLFIERWLSHQRRDAFWKHGSVCEDYAAILTPVLAVGGWADSYTNTVLRLLAGLSAPCRAIIGPWGHDYPHTGVPGPAIGFLGECLRWWDHWLKGEDRGVMEDPALRVWINEAVPPDATNRANDGRWLGLASWPSASVGELALTLGDGTLSGTPAPERELVHRSPQTLGGAAGEWCPYGQAADQPGDQRADDAHALVFETAPFDAPADFLGAPVAELLVAVDRAQAFLALRLMDVAPDGGATRISYGLLNLTHRSGHEAPEPMPAGTPVPVRIRLNDIGHRVLPGHRLRLAISTAYWPTVWPSPAPVALTVTAGRSLLRLPVLTGPVLPVAFGPAEGAAPEARLRLSGGETRRVLETDQLTGRQTLTVVNDDGLLETPAAGLEVGRRCEERYSILPDDPLSASLDAAWTMRLGRGDWQVRTETEARMTATADAFLVSVALDAWEGDTRLRCRRWEVRVPRDGV